MKLNKLEELIQYAQDNKVPYKDFRQMLAETRKVYLVRHATTDFNGDEERIRSIVDIGLSEKGLLQANSTGIELSSQDIGCVYTSDMKRAKQTARAIQLNTNSLVEHYPQFRAWNLGSLAGKKTASVQDIMDDLIKNPDKLPPDSNESYNMFKQRNITGYYDAIKFEGNIAIVTHYSNCKLILDYLGRSETDLEPGGVVEIG